MDRDIIQDTSYGNIIRSICSPADQEYCNSCWAISVAQVISDRLRLRGEIDINDELNYYALHDWASSTNNINDGCNYGSYPSTGMNWAVDKGIPLMSESRDRSFDDKIIRGDMNGRLFQIEDWLEDDISNMKKILRTRGSVMIIINLYDSFDSFTGSGIYQPREGESIDPYMSHMLSVVGYNDTDNTWILRNSYGKSWGFNGLIKIPMNDRRIIDEGKIYYPRI